MIATLGDVLLVVFIVVGVLVVVMLTRLGVEQKMLIERTRLWQQHQ